MLKFVTLKETCLHSSFDWKLIVMSDLQNDATPMEVDLSLCQLWVWGVTVLAVSRAKP